MRQKEKQEVAAIGRMLFDEIAERLPSKIGKKAVREAMMHAGLLN